MVTDHQDALLATVVERLPETARRALFLVSDGFDQQPEDFYAGYGEVDDHLAGALEDATLEWAQNPRTRGGPTEPKAGRVGPVLLFGQCQQSLSGGGCPHPMEASSVVAA